MSKRHEAIGIKQSIRFEWMQKTVNLLLAGIDATTIRQELHEFLSDRKSNGTQGERSEQTRSFVVTNLMNIWVSPAQELLSLRNASLEFLREYPSLDLAVHWGMISAAYPFWFNVAKQTGRLLALQDQVTQTQIINRLKEQYGDRPTVERYTRFVIRSFVTWGVLKDAETRGCYKKTSPVAVNDTDLIVLLFESALHAIPDNKGALSLLLNSPSFFPFQLQIISGELISQNCKSITVRRYGLDEELLELTN